MIGRLHHLILDCREPATLAAFWADVLGLPVTYRSEDFVVVAVDDHTSGIAFQRAADHHPPRWPDPAYPQQIHPDVMVDDLDIAAAQVTALGATPLGAGDHVYADPAGHPFCLITRPAWAPPIHPAADPPALGASTRDRGASRPGRGARAVREAG